MTCAGGAVVVSSEDQCTGVVWRITRRAGTVGAPVIKQTRWHSVLFGAQPAEHHSRAANMNQG